jgi:hypothetical protein
MKPYKLIEYGGGEALFFGSMTNPALPFPTFKSYLAQLPTDIVFKHFLSHQGHGRKILSSSSIDDITRQMSGEKSIGERFSKLSTSGKFAVSLVYLFGRRGLETPQAITGFDDELLDSFLVFAGKSETGKTFYFGFPEFEARLAPLAAAVINNQAKTAVAREPADLLPWLCLNDVTVLCICASAGMLRMTRKGTFAKVSETVMKRFLHATHDMADPFRLLLNYALEKGLMQLDNDIFRARPNKILAWLDRPLAERYVEFREFTITSVPLWSMAVVEALFAGPGPARLWLSLPQAGEAARKEVRSVLMCLRYLGLLDVCKTGGSLSFIRAQSPGTDGIGVATRQAGRIILLADFSAVLTREVLPEELYWFSKAGSLESFDTVYKGLVKRQIINDSLSEGIDENKLVRYLESWNAPPNVLVTVKEWIREFSRMYITSDPAIISADERATSQILSYEPLKRLIEPVQSDRVFRIRPGREQEVRRVLVSMGFDPRMPGEAGIRKPAATRSGISLEPSFAAAEDAQETTDPPVLGESSFGAQGRPLGVVGPATIRPVVSFGGTEAQELGPRPVKEGKYGQKLKELDMSDLFHVLDYAVLMGHAVTFEYRGSPLVKKGMYKVSPVNVQKTPEPFLDACVLPKKARRKFLLKCIVRIGVESA